MLARKFGRGAETDGFFAAYAVYLLVVLAATALRAVVMPRLARADAAGRLGAEAAGYAGALALLAAPALAVSTFAPGWVAALLAGTLPEEGKETAAAALVWLVPAAVAQLYAALAASVLAARDSYGTAAVGFASGAVASLVVFVALAETGGIEALAWGLAVGGALSLAVPLARLLAAGALGVSPASLRPGRRIAELAQGVALPLALHGLYVIAVRFAAELGVGQVTSLSYAYLIAAFVVAATASSLALVSSVPLTRRGIEGERAAAHIVSASWPALVVVAGAAGVFALTGGTIIAALLGPAFAGEVGADLGRLVVYLSLWMVATVGATVTFPLVFVARRARLLPVLAAAALAIHVPVEWLGMEAFGLPGIAFGLGVTTALVFGGLVAAVSPRTLVGISLRLGGSALVAGALAAGSFVAAALVLDPVPAAAAGLLLYGLALAALRPRGLRASWAYLRALR